MHSNMTQSSYTLSCLDALTDIEESLVILVLISVQNI